MYAMSTSPGRGMVIRGKFPSPWSLPSASSLTFLASDLGRYQGEQSRYELKSNADVTKTREYNECRLIVATVVGQLFFESLASKLKTHGCMTEHVIP